MGENNPINICDCKPRVSQGDIFKNVEYLEYLDQGKDESLLHILTFPYVIVLSQDCDLEQDYKDRNKEKKSKHDKHLISVIIAPIYNFEHFVKGEHLNDIGYIMEIISSKPKGIILQNNNPRYHYLEFPKTVKIPNSVIDFKHYFTVKVNYLESIADKNRVCKVSELYREQISHRFAYYLSRIGLPDNVGECQK